MYLLCYNIFLWNHKYFRFFKLNFFLNYFQFGQLWSKYLSVDIPWQDSVWSGARFSCQDGSRCILHHFVMVIKERLTLKGIISPHINKTVFFPLIPLPSTQKYKRNSRDNQDVGTVDSEPFLVRKFDPFLSWWWDVDTEYFHWYTWTGSLLGDRQKHNTLWK